MSIIKANELESPLGNKVLTEDVAKIAVGGKNLCKAWVNFDGTNQTVRQSFNVSSVTNHATSGVNTVNFTVPMSSADYVVSTSGEYNTSYHGMLNIYPNGRTAGSVSVVGMSGSATAAYLGMAYRSDLPTSTVAVFGNS